MSRTSTALKRLGVTAVAVVTVAAVVPALNAPALANHTVTAITLSPDADSAPTGTCNQFTATVTFSNAGDTATVDLLAQPRATGQQVQFCNLNADGTQTPAQTNAVPGTPNSVRTEIIVDAPDGSTTGSQTFGIVSQQAGVIDVTAFVENIPGSTGTNNNAPDGNEPRDTSVKTFTTGGAGAVTTLDAEPESAVNIQGDTHTFTARLTQADGSPVPGVGAGPNATATPTSNVKFRITSGPDASTTVVRNCDTPPQSGTTDQNGTVSCSFTNNGGPGTDTILVFLDRDGDGIADADEPSDEITKVFQAPQQAGTTVQLTCESVRTNAAGDQCTNPLSENTERFTATVRNAAGQPVAGAAVAFAITGQTNDVNGTDGANGTTANPDRETLSPTTCLTDANGQCSTTLTNPRTNENETVTVRARIVTGPGSTNVDDFATKTFSNPEPRDARNIALTPATQNAGVPGVAPVTATVTDRFGNPVSGVQVTFTENGTGRFINGSTTFVAITNAQGQATAELQAVAGDAAGTNTVTGTITGFDNNRNGVIDTGETRGVGTADDECESVATSTGGGTNNNLPGGTAGNCSATATVVFGGTTASPSAPPAGSASPRPSAPAGSGPPNAACTVPATVSLERTTITATGSSGVTVRATPNSIIDLFAYTRPSTTFRVVRSAEVGADGIAEFRIVPPANTRLYAQQRGCNASPSIVLNVRTALSLNVTRTGVRAYRFFGDSLPARPGGLIISLYRVTNDGRQILTSQTRANATNGEWVINRVFTGTGRFGFVVRTGQDLQNAPGASNVRSLLIF